jgi:K+-transporting ATPase ATPase C chain
MWTSIRTAALMLLVFTVLTGVAYPLLVTGIAQGMMPSAAIGSLMMRDGKAVGSALIGQPFGDPKYFWGRPSATGPFPYNAAASSGSNLGPTNPALIEAVRARIAALRAADPGNEALVPVDLVTASASGLDPHISPAAAQFQLPRVARVRGLSPQRVQQLVADHTEPRQLGILGESRVDVLRLNLALDGLKS